MSAFFFAAGVTRAQVQPARSRHEAGETFQTWDTCVTQIVYGGDLAQAQKAFEDWCRLSPEGEKPVETVIKRLVGAQFVEQFLTESGGKLLDWPEIAQKLGEEVSATPVDDFEQGYWVDINHVLPPGKVSADIDSLQRELPEDIRSGMNWSAAKQFLFLVTVLSPLPAPVCLDEGVEEEQEKEDEEDKWDGSAEAEEEKEPVLEENIACLPEMRDKEAAAIVQARNSVVAAWLWRKFAAETPLAQNEIQILQVSVPIPVVSPA